MKIYSLVSPSFKGIVVRNGGQDPKEDSRSVQKTLLENFDTQSQVLKKEEVTSAVEGVKKARANFGITSLTELWGRISSRYDGGDVFRSEKSALSQAIEETKQQEIILGLKDGLLSGAEKTIEQIDIRNIKKAETETAQGILAKRNNGRIDDVIGYEYELGILDREFISKVEREKQGEDVDIFGSILFFGPSGNGKTYITKAVAGETGCKVKKIGTCKFLNSDEKQAILMKDIIKTAEEAEENFQKTRTRTILFFDEADQIINKNSSIKDKFEEFIKTCSKKYHCSVFCATNNPLNMGLNFDDDEVFPVRMSIDLPDKQTISNMFKYNLKDTPKSELDYDEISSELDGKAQKHGGKYSNGEICDICEELIVSKGGNTVYQDDVIGFINSNENKKPVTSGEVYKKFLSDCDIIMKS